MRPTEWTQRPARIGWQPWPPWHHCYTLSGRNLPKLANAVPTPVDSPSDRVAVPTWRHCRQTSNLIGPCTDRTDGTSCEFGRQTFRPVWPTVETIPGTVRPTESRKWPKSWAADDQGCKFQTLRLAVGCQNGRPIESCPSPAVDYLGRMSRGRAKPEWLLFLFQEERNNWMVSFLQFKRIMIPNCAFLPLKAFWKTSESTKATSPRRLCKHFKAPRLP